MKQLSQSRFRKILLGVYLPFVAAPAIAQGLLLEEIVVTATKRETNLLETSAAISAFNSSRRDELGIDVASDLAIHTPSLTIAPSRISIRGIGRPNIALGSDPGVGLYWDGVYNTENDVFSFSNFLDIDRIEVLRGPQGTLYGRNSIGGAINFVSKQPTDEPSGMLRAEVGNFDYWVVQGLFSGPLTENLSGLFAASQISRDGFQENVDTGADYDQADSTYLTATLRHATDRWTNSIKLSWRDSDLATANPYILEPYSTDLVFDIDDVDTGENINFPGFFPGQNFANLNQGVTRPNPALEDINNVSIDFDPVQTSERRQVFFISEYSADRYNLKYTFGYSEFEFTRNHDADALRAEDSGLDWSLLDLEVADGVFIPVSALTGITRTPSFLTRPFSQDADFLSHELQFTSQLDGAFQFIGGLYYFRSNEDQRLSFIEENEDLLSIYAFFGSFINGAVDEDGFLFRGEAMLETTSYAAYGQLQWDVTDRTQLSFGLRFSRDEKDGGDNTFVQYVGDPNDPTVFRSAEDSWSQATWRLGVDHSISENHFLYAFLATGYRSGGFNFLQPTDNTNVDRVDPEELLSFEIGYKGSLLDGRLNLSTAAYIYDYEDLQILRTDVVNGVTLTVYDNAAEATAWGLETEVSALLTDSLAFSGTWSHNQTEYDEFTALDTNACAIGPFAEGRGQDPICTQSQDLSGNTFLLSPENKFSANLTYQWQMLNLEWSATTSYIFIDDQFTSAFNNPLYDIIDDYDRWDARLNMRAPEGAWEITAFIKNISDDRAVTLRTRPDSTTHNAATSLAEPRLYGLRASYNF